MVINFQKSAKNLIFWDFQPIFSKLGFFGKNPAVSVISKYHPQSRCPVSETSYTPFSRTLKVPNQLTDPHRNSSTGAEAQLPLRTVIYSHSLKNEYFLTRFSQKNRKNYKFHYFVLKRSFPVTNFLGNSKNLLFYHF